MLEKWKAKLNITDDIETYRVRSFQVENTYNRPYRLNGICRDGDKYILYHQDKLTDELVCHELLHIKMPTLSEKEVRELTRILNG